jgi:tetratricopeptide (TPR) repeat protein
MWKHHQMNLESDEPDDVLRDKIEQALAHFELTGQAERTERMIEGALEEIPMDSLFVGSRPYMLLARAYRDLGDLDRTRQWMALRDRELPAELRGSRGPGKLSALIDIDEGRVDEGIERLEALEAESECIPCFAGDIARAYESSGRPFEAIQAYERYLGFRYLYAWLLDAQIGPMLYRLGSLYDETGQTEKAIDAYSKFVERWKNADPELQPQVEEAKRRIGDLLAETARERTALGG